MLQAITKHGEIEFEQVCKLADGFNGADLRNVVGVAVRFTAASTHLLWLQCTEAGMFAIRDNRDYTINEDFMKAVRKLQDVKKLETTIDYDKV